MELILYSAILVVLSVGSFIFGKRVRRWWLIVTPLIVGALLSFTVGLFGFNSDRCSNAIDQNICGIGSGLQVFLGFAVAGMLLIGSLVAGISSFFGYRTKRNRS